MDKMDKYAKLATTHIFYPFAVETSGTWHNMAIGLTQDVGRRITTIKKTQGNNLSFPTPAIAFQGANAVCFHNTMLQNEELL